MTPASTKRESTGVPTIDTIGIQPANANTPVNKFRITAPIEEYLAPNELARNTRKTIARKFRTTSYWFAYDTVSKAQIPRMQFSCGVGCVVKKPPPTTG